MAASSTLEIEIVEAYQVQVPMSVPVTFLQDVFVTALEGGIGYWSQATLYRPGEDGDSRFKAEVVDEDDAELVIDASTILEGLSRSLDSRARINSRLQADIRSALDEQCAGNIDADAADVIVQFGLFGEIVYG